MPLSTFKSSRKIGDLLGMYHSKQGCALCVYIRLGALEQILTTHFKFFSITFSEILYFSTKINQLKIINFKRAGLTFIQNNHTYFYKWYQISIIGRAMNRIYMCGLLTNHRHGNYILMYELWFISVRPKCTLERIFLGNVVQIINKENLLLFLFLPYHDLISELYWICLQMIMICWIHVFLSGIFSWKLDICNSNSML